ncbi:hypothetical protein ACLB2K_023674 [Fragaria x ananassa]
MSGAGIHPYHQQWPRWQPLLLPRPSSLPRLTFLLTTSSFSTSCNAQLYGRCNFTAVVIGPHLYILNGSLFDSRSFPIDRSSSSSAVFWFDFTTDLSFGLPPHRVQPRREQDELGGEV